MKPELLNGLSTSKKKAENLFSSDPWGAPKKEEKSGGGRHQIRCGGAEKETLRSVSPRGDSLVCALFEEARGLRGKRLDSFASRHR